MVKSVYKNALRTKEKIKNAFLELLKRKEIGKIRIHEIAELAEITKGTFYCHYTDIFAVLGELENEHVVHLMQQMSLCGGEAILDDLTPLLYCVINYINQNYKFFVVIFKSKVSGSFAKKMQKLFVDFMMQDERIVSRLTDANIARRFFSFVAVGTCRLILEHYMEHEQANPQELIETLNQGILHGMSAFKGI